jgi:8-oxo-dGTP pyrophosphatase MutT (NUDIX family)
VLPPEQYVASLARKRMAASALFRDEAGRVLLVEPTYKPAWDLPGGAVEAEESPHAACRREVREELGLDRGPGRVLAVDWVPSRPRDGVIVPDGVIIVYDGGTLTEAEAKEVVVADGELAGFAFVSCDEIAGRVTPLVARRITACLDALAASTVAALENGSPAA